MAAQDSYIDATPQAHAEFFGLHRDLHRLRDMREAEMKRVDDEYTQQIHDAYERLHAFEIAHAGQRFTLPPAPDL